MAQRITTQRQIYYGIESTEGVDPYAGSNPPGGNAILVTNLKVSPDLAFNQRSFVGQLGNYTGKIGAQTDPMLSFTLEARGGSAGGTVVPSIDPLLNIIFGYVASPLTNASSRVLDTGASTLTGADSTNTSLHVVSSANFTVGNAVAVETGNLTGVYEVAWIAAIPDGTHITLSEALTSGVNLANGSNVKPSITYKPANSGHGSAAFQMYLDSTSRVSFMCCKGSLKLDAPAPGAVPTFTFMWRAINWLDTVGGIVARPTPTYDTAVPPTPYKFKIDATAPDIKLANWELRQTVARKRSQNSTYGTFSQLVTDRDLRGFVQAYDVDETQFNNWGAGTEQAVSHQFGSTLLNMVAYRIPKAQRTDVNYGDDNGLTTDQVSFEGNIGVGADELRLAFL